MKTIGSDKRDTRSTGKSTRSLNQNDIYEAHRMAELVLAHFNSDIMHLQRASIVLMQEVSVCKLLA